MKRITLTQIFFAFSFLLALPLPADAVRRQKPISFRTDFLPEDAARAYDEGIEHLKKGRLDEAVISLEQSIEYYGTNAPAMANLGVVYSNKGDSDKALEYFQKSMTTPLGPSAGIPIADESEPVKAAEPSGKRVPVVAGDDAAQCDPACRADMRAGEEPPAVQPAGVKKKAVTKDRLRSLKKRILLSL